MEEFLRIGVITRTHGIKGEVKVYPTTDSPGRFREVRDVILKTENKELETQVSGARLDKQMAIVHFSCFETPEEAAKWRGADVLIHRKDAQPLAEGEYYIADLIGCRVLLNEESVPLLSDPNVKAALTPDLCIGTVKDVLQTGANDVYIIDGPKKEILIPVIQDCIKQVDIEKGEIHIQLLPGLL